MIHGTTDCRVVTRPGVVVNVQSTTAEIQVVRSEACGSCTLRRVCAPGAEVTQIVTAHTPERLRPGMQVEISMEERWVVLGTVFAFVLPFLVVVSVFFGIRPSVAREEYAGIGAIAALVPYYLLLYGARNRFARFVTFFARPAPKEGEQ